MRTRMYGGVRGRKTKVGGKPTFVFLLLDYKDCTVPPQFLLMFIQKSLAPANQMFKFDLHNL